MKVFDLELTPELVETIAAHAEGEYPREACGLGFGRVDSPEVVRVVPMQNMQDRYHQLDPERFPRDGRDAFRLDELERMRLLEEVSAEGLTERVLYHSHCDAGAYFSPEDRAMAVFEGLELMPNVVHLVLSVRRGARSDLAAYKWNDQSQAFDEVRIPGARMEAPAEPAFPDLGLRAMEGRDSARPLRPVGGAAIARRISAAERDALAPWAEGRRVQLETATQVEDLLRFGRGLYSPVPGFMRRAEARSVTNRGRLQSGTPWRVPITLELRRAKAARELRPTTVIELLDLQGAPRALLAVEEARADGKDLTLLAGPVFVYPEGLDGDAADVRAGLLRRGAQRVLAVPPEELDRLPEVDTEAFDAVIELGRSGAGRHAPWLTAAMAQNQGATHLWIEDPGTARAVEDSLEIRPWRPGQDPR